MERRVISVFMLLLILLCLPGIGGCGEKGRNEDADNIIFNSEAGADNEDKKTISVELSYVCSMETEYAENFRADYYENEKKEKYVLLEIIPDGTEVLVVPEGGKVPSDLAESVIVMQRPVKDLYLVASAAMDLFVALDSLDSVKYSGQKQENWYIPEAAKAMEEGRILYAGKYSKPDYEMIVSNGCSLAIENTMIFHSPDVIEQLNNFGIPVIVDRSSGEEHPLGRVEWIRFYGALLGREEEAEAIFKEESDLMKEIESDEKSGLTVAYFYITSNNLVQVRKSTDYIPKMIEIAGGKYIFDDLDDGTAKSTVNMQLEEFYNQAKDADIIIYNSSIDGGVESVDDLTGKFALLKEFKAVKEGRVYCTTNDSYQQSLSVAYMTEDIHSILKGKEEGLHYIYKCR